MARLDVTVAGARPQNRRAIDSRSRNAVTIEQSFGPNPVAGSGLLSGTIDIDVKGVPRFKQPISLSMSGPFRQDNLG